MINAKNFAPLIAVQSFEKTRTLNASNVTKTLNRAVTKTMLRDSDSSPSESLPLLVEKILEEAQYRSPIVLEP